MTRIQIVIQALRDKGWSVRAIAEYLGVRRQTLNYWIAGDHQPWDVHAVLEALHTLMEVKRIPKQRRYGARAHVGPKVV